MCPVMEFKPQEFSYVEWPGEHGGILTWGERERAQRWPVATSKAAQAGSCHLALLRGIGADPVWSRQSPEERAELIFSVTTTYTH